MDRSCAGQCLPAHARHLRAQDPRVALSLIHHCFLLLLVLCARLSSCTAVLLSRGKVDEKTKLPLKASLFNRKKRFPLADVTRLRYGASASARFAKYNLSAKSMPWVAFSVHFPDKVLDLVCTGPNAEKDVARWFSGVQALAPLSTAYLSGAGLIWRRAQLKIRYYAMWQNITPALFLEDLVAAARQDVPHGRMPETPVVYLLDKQIANTPEEGQAKEKGKK